MDLIELIKQLGFPVAIAVYFIWQNGRIEKEHKDDIKTIANTAVEAINKNTESDKVVADQLVKNNTALENNGRIINRLEGYLQSKPREQSNGNMGS